MPIPETIGAFAIIPCNDLAVALPFWERLGFAPWDWGLRCAHRACR
jgi:hypothetical protein